VRVDGVPSEEEGQHGPSLRYVVLYNGFKMLALLNGLAEGTRNLSVEDMVGGGRTQRCSTHGHSTRPVCFSGGCIAHYSPAVASSRSNTENSLPERRVRRPACARQLRSKTQRKNKKRDESDANAESGVPRADIRSGGLQYTANDCGTRTGLTTHEGTWKGHRVGTMWGEGGAGNHVGVNNPSCHECH
jgi:hypothetical protein